MPQDDGRLRDLLWGDDDLSLRLGIHRRRHRRCEFGPLPAAEDLFQVREQLRLFKVAGDRQLEVVRYEEFIVERQKIPSLNSPDALLRRGRSERVLAIDVLTQQPRGHGRWIVVAAADSFEQLPAGHFETALIEVRPAQQV